MSSYRVDEHFTAIDVPIEDGHARWLLGRLRGDVDAIRYFERRRTEAETRRDAKIIEAVEGGFSERDVARAARVRVGVVRHHFGGEQ